MAATAGGYNIDDYLIPIDSTLRIYNPGAGSNMNVLGVSPDAIGKIEVDGVTLTTNAQGAMMINLANPNTWTALQTFGNNISFGGATLDVASLATGQYVYYNGTNWVNTNAVDGTTLKNTSGTLSINLANANTWTATQTFATIVPSLVNISSATTSVTGTTAGSFIWDMPFQGSGYKKVVVYLDGYENDTTTAQTITFPTAFSYAPNVYNPAAVPGITASTTALSIDPDTTTVYTAWIIVEGF